jgi:hypothetical protein
MVLHGHEHISANYFLIADQECGTADQDESSLVFQAGTLSRGGKINEPIDSYISFYRYEVREETISIGQFNFRNNPRSFIGCCEIITKRNRRKYYRFSVNETWEIDKFLNNKGRREIICRAWQGQKVETIEQVIGSTIPANFEDIDFKPERKDGNIEVIDVKGKKPFDLKHITLKLTPPMLDSCDDVITLSYKWDKDFMELSTGRIESVYWYPKRLDSYGLTIQGHINIEASEIYCEGKHIFKREEDKMVFSVENLRPGKRIHFVLVAKE